MRAVCYLRIGKTKAGLVFGVTANQSLTPLTSGYPAKDIPTRQFKLLLSLPDDLFRSCDAEIEINVPSAAVQVVASATVGDEEERPYTPEAEPGNESV